MAKSRLSNKISYVSPAPTLPENTVLPVISGTPNFEQTLSVSNGTWTNSPSSFTYQWKRGGVNISLATNSTYVLVGPDVGTNITCTVTATNGAGSGNATTLSVAVTLPAAVAIGTIVDETFTGGLADWTVTTASGGNMAMNAGKLRLTGGTGVFTTYMTYTKANSPFLKHTLEKWKVRVYFTSPTVSASTYGFGMGMRSTAQFTNIDNLSRNSLDSGSPLGSTYFYTAQAHTASPNQDVQGSFSYANATDYSYEVERNKNVFTTRIYNAGGSVVSTQTKTYNITTSASGVWCNNIGQFTIWNFGGTIDITRIVISSDQQRFADLGATGDSNMHGLYCGANSTRYVEQAAVTKGISAEIWAGIDEGVKDGLDEINFLVYMRPKKLYMCRVSNSIANGVATGTWQADHVSTTNVLDTENIPYILGVPVARGVLYTTNVTSWYATQYPGKPVVNKYLVTKNGGNDNLQAAFNTVADGIHMNAAGNNVCDDPLAAVL